jgi:flagellar biosynthesis protein FliR
LAYIGIPMRIVLRLVALYIGLSVIATVFQIGFVPG